jgi:hypothetical protein
MSNAVEVCTACISELQQLVDDLAKAPEIATGIIEKLQPFLDAPLTWQQLQDTELLQHMGAMLASAVGGLTAAAAAAAAAAFEAEPCSSSGGSMATEQQVADSVKAAGSLVYQLLRLYNGACNAWIQADSSMGPSVPAAAARERPVHRAVVTSILTTFQTYSQLQQLAGSKDSPAPAVRLAADTAFHNVRADTLHAAVCAMRKLAERVHKHSFIAPSPQPVPGAREVLMCPELVPCLAITVLVAVLVLDTGAGGAAGSSSDATARVLSTTASRSSSAATASSSHCYRSSGTGECSTIGDGQGRAEGGPAPTTQTTLHDQQPAATQAATSSAAPQAGGSSYSSIPSSSADLGNGVSLDCLTPLSRGLFSLLGVDQGVLLQAAAAAGRGTGMDINGNYQPSDLAAIMSVYCDVLAFQVSREQSWTIPVRPCPGPFA